MSALTAECGSAGRLRFATGSRTLALARYVERQVAERAHALELAKPLPDGRCTRRSASATERVQPRSHDRGLVRRCGQVVEVRSGV